MTVPAFHVRPATPHDAPSIARVEVASWQATYASLMPDAFLRDLPRTQQARALGWYDTIERSDTTVLVTEDARGVTGFTNGGPMRELPGFDAELHAIYLLPGAQRQGSGRALVTTLARALLGCGHASMAVWVLRDNPARRFYIRLGGQFVTEKDTRIGGVLLREEAYGWPHLKELATRSSVH